ncbi:hypothetical protein [Roseateles sp.]|uniref:hypothetical protein n=1 Tax=Roseateles sp. TaxID=1971397 RepID=UPI0025D445C2|nr:hypothetical protein [Roseateles sp.]MBV8036598.1 hypothetical protein [Roseateles sp.]
MQRVPDRLARCAAAQQDRYCVEWRFTREPSLRLVAEGGQDDGGWTLYRVDGRGRYRRLLEVRPALQDDRWPGQTFWGYALDVTDAVATAGAGGVRLSFSFQSAALEAGDSPPTIGQRQLPHLLLWGQTTQPNIVIREPLRFEVMTSAQAKVRSRQRGVTVIDGARAAIVAFAPTDALGATDDGSVEGIAHTQFALRDARRCLGTRDIDYRLVFADRFKVVTNGLRVDYRGHQLGQGFGAVLVNPGQAPRLVVAREGPSTLQQLLPQAASELWREPACVDLR